MKVAIDIDSTLHHHWDILSEISLRRFGIELPYEEQLTWGTTRLRPEQLAVCVSESHSEERIIAAVPYPGAVEAIKMAIADSGGTVLGRNVVVLVADHQNKPDIGASKFREWADRKGLNFLIAGANTG